MIVENGISGRADAQMKALRGTGSRARLCEQFALFKAAQGKAVSLLENNPSLCGYPRASVDALRSNWEHLQSITDCGDDAGSPGL